jgi:hypothetical protein
VKGANLDSADLDSADLGGADLTCANLTRANLIDANLFSTNLRGANLSGAHLKNANLCGADLYCTVLTLCEDTLTVNFMDAKNLSWAQFYTEDGQCVVGIAVDSETGRLVPEKPPRSNAAKSFEAIAENTVRFADIYPGLLAQADYLPKGPSPLRRPRPRLSNPRPG